MDPRNTMTEVTSKAIHTQDTTHSILRSALRFFSGTAISRVSGMFRDISLAFAFGTNEAVASLFVAFRLSHVLRRFFGEGALQSAFVPVFEELKAQSPTRAFAFFRDLNALWIILLSVVVAIGAGGLLASISLFQLDSSTQMLLYLILIMLPSLLPICLFGLNASLLQCYKKFFTVGFAPTIFNITFAIAAFITKSDDSNKAMTFLAFSIVVGCAFQWIATLIPTLSITKEYFLQGWSKGLKLFSDDIKKLWKPLSLGMLGIGASQINNAIDSLFGRWADPEGPAQLWYSLRLQQLPLALFGIALSGALLPPLSRAVQANQQKEFLSFLDFAIRKTVAFLAPCTAYLFVLGSLIIYAIYGRGDFQAHSVLTTTICLHGYALGLIPAGLIVIFAPAFFAKKNFLIPAKGALLSLCINALLDTFFVFGLEMKALSVAMATFISSSANALFLYHHLRKEWGTILTPSAISSCFKICLCSLGAFLATFYFMGQTTGYPMLFSLFAESCATLPHVFYERIYWLGVTSLVFAGSLLTLAKLCKVEDLLLVKLFKNLQK